MNCFTVQFLFYASTLICDSTVFHQISRTWNRECRIFIIISYSLHMSKKKRWDFKIRQMYFSRFYEDIYYWCLTRNLQYTNNWPFQRYLPPYNGGRRELVAGEVFHSPSGKSGKILQYTDIKLCSGGQKCHRFYWRQTCYHMYFSNHASALK